MIAPDAVLTLALARGEIGDDRLAEVQHAIEVRSAQYAQLAGSHDFMARILSNRLPLGSLPRNPTPRPEITPH